MYVGINSKRNGTDLSEATLDVKTSSWRRFLNCARFALLLPTYHKRWLVSRAEGELTCGRYTYIYMCLQILSNEQYPARHATYIGIVNLLCHVLSLEKGFTQARFKT